MLHNNIRKYQTLISLFFPGKTVLKHLTHREMGIIFKWVQTTLLEYDFICGLIYYCHNKYGFDNEYKGTKSPWLTENDLHDLTLEGMFFNNMYKNFPREIDDLTFYEHLYRREPGIMEYSAFLKKNIHDTTCYLDSNKYTLEYRMFDVLRSTFIHMFKLLNLPEDLCETMLYMDYTQGRLLLKYLHDKCESEEEKTIIENAKYTIDCFIKTAISIECPHTK